jgi:hypothetical protein
MAGLHLHVRLHAHCTAAKAKPKQNNWALHYLAASHMHAACMPYACFSPGPQQLSYSRRATCTSDFAAREYEIDRSIDREDRTAALLAPTTPYRFPSGRRMDGSWMQVDHQKTYTCMQTEQRSRATTTTCKCDLITFLI